MTFCNLSVFYQRKTLPSPTPKLTNGALYDLILPSWNFHLLFWIIHVFVPQRQHNFQGEIVSFLSSHLGTQRRRRCLKYIIQCYEFRRWWCKELMFLLCTWEFLINNVTVSVTGLRLVACKLQSCDETLCSAFTHAKAPKAPHNQL